jgi:hypothetical protein
MKRVLILLSALLLLSGCGQKQKTRDASKEAGADSYRTLKWMELMSPEEQQYYAEVEAGYEKDPDFVHPDSPPRYAVNPEMEGQKIRIPGYIVGMDTDPGNFAKVSSFLFVPWQGACIHVPPPPSNLTIFVRLDEPVVSNPFEPFWLFGTVSIEEGSNELASFSYTLQADRIEAVEMEE